MHLRILHIIILTGFGVTASAQLQPLIDQYHFNELSINPAYTGAREALDISIYGRNQWVGFEGTPSTYSLSIHSPLKNEKVNLGLTILSDRLGSRSETGFLINYAYRIQIRDGKFSLGLAAGLSYLTRDLASLRYTQTADPLLQDPLPSKLVPQFSFGAYYYTDQYYIGLSMPLFLNYGIEGNKVGLNLSTANYMLAAGYYFTVSDEVEILPSVVLRSIPANDTQLDLHCSAILRQKVRFGIGYRTSGNLSALVQVQINPQFRLGYSYGYELSKLSSYQNGTHEIMINYRFRYLIDAMSPRYF